MARKARRTQPGDAANIFIRCLLSDAGEMLGGLTEEQWAETLAYFDHRCPYTGAELTSETAVKDHAVPINKKHCGLHLFGNVVPCTDQANKDKHNQHYRDFVKDPRRLEKIEAFVEQTSYQEKAAVLGDLQAYCETQYEVVTGLCRRNRDYLKRITGYVDPEPDPMPAPADGGLADDAARRSGVLPITLNPASPAAFKRLLLSAKRAWITTHYNDGRSERREWRADRFQPTSNVFGNLRSRPEFRQGEWQRLGIRSISVSVGPMEE